MRSRRQQVNVSRLRAVKNYRSRLCGSRRSFACSCRFGALPRVAKFSLGARARVLRRVLVAGAFGCAMLGAYLDSIVLIVAGMVAAVPSVVAFARAARPHNHWAEFRRRRPGDP